MIKHTKSTRQSGSAALPVVGFAATLLLAKFGSDFSERYQKEQAATLKATESSIQQIAAAEHSNRFIKLNGPFNYLKTTPQTATANLLSSGVVISQKIERPVMLFNASSSDGKSFLVASELPPPDNASSVVGKVYKVDQHFKNIIANANSENTQYFLHAEDWITPSTLSSARKSISTTP